MFLGEISQPGDEKKTLETNTKAFSLFLGKKLAIVARY
jgi:hypothetical protein